MANFDQRGQQVVYQFNATGDINFGAAQNKAELVGELRKLLSELNKATQAGVVQKEIALDVESHIKEAVIQAEKPVPNKKSILDHINGAKTLLESITSATGLVTALIQAAKLVGSLFL